MTEYYFFSGKGGVGKTTTAAATALWHAKRGKKTLVISIDPAHSLADSFEKRIGPKVTKLADKLWGIEIDPEDSMDEYKQKFLPQIEKNAGLSALGLGDLFDMAGSTPGIDELAAFDKFLQFLSSDKYDIIVFDTAPTGHTLRFLSLPEVLDSWVGKAIKMRMMLSGVTGLISRILPFGDKGQNAKHMGMDQLEAMKKRIAHAREVLADPARTKFVLVLIPEEMSILESERSLKTLAKYNIPVASVIVNQLVPENAICEFCASRRKQQQARLGLVKKKFPRKPVKTLPLFPQEIKGQKLLAEVGKLLEERL